MVTECRQDPQGFFSSRQKLLVRRGNCDPVPVFDPFNAEPMPDTLGLCRLFGYYRYGSSAPAGGGVKRLGVRPDGSGVVFEVNDGLSIFSSLSPEQKGFFLVRADGSGLRRLGPASRAPCFQIVPFPDPLGLGVIQFCGLPFSPDGRSVVFTDLGPGPAGETAIQVVTLARFGSAVRLDTAREIGSADIEAEGL